MGKHARLSLAFVVALMWGCGGDDDAPRDAGSDAGLDATTSDAGPDAARDDAGADDGGPEDAGTSDTGIPACTLDAMCDDFQPCNGVETCDPVMHVCVDAPPLADGTPCGGGSGLICLSELCVPTRCGDGVIDTAAGEECEDGNDVPDDGCENDCTYTCEADPDCPDDGESCNGTAVCDTTMHTCATSAPPATGEACTAASGAPGTCQAMVCVAAGCGNMVVETGEDCDDGNLDDTDGCTRMCSFTCVSAAQCSDGNVCNGTETCSLATHRCGAGTGMVCRDTSACTTDTCNPITGCVFTLRDADGDGHAASSIGACGDDCNDSNADVYTGHSEVCMDGLDNDCNGIVDDGLTTWFADCDGDGYGATGAVTVMQCTRPATSATGCGTASAQWITRNPATGPDCNDAIATVYPGAVETVGNERDDNCDTQEICYRDGDGDGYRTTSTVTSVTNTTCRDSGEARSSLPSGDCCDSDSDAHPGQTTYFPTATDCGGFDYNCINGAELRYPTSGAIACVNAGGGTCTRVGPAEGWNTPPGLPPACGVLGTYNRNCHFATGGCAFDMTVMPQTCR